MRPVYNSKNPARINNNNNISFNQNNSPNSNQNEQEPNNRNSRFYQSTSRSLINKPNKGNILQRENGVQQQEPINSRSLINSNKRNTLQYESPRNIQQNNEMIPRRRINNNSGEEINENNNIKQRDNVNPISTKIPMNVINRNRAHYFIGNMLKNMEQIRLLNNIKRRILKTYKLKNYHVNFPFCSNLIYLGYFEESTINLYMENLISKLLNALVERIRPLVCRYTRYSISSDKSYYKIGLEYNDINNFLTKIIIPYLVNYGFKPIYEVDTFSNPIINLYFYQSSKIQPQEQISVFIPTDTFTINNLSLIKGTSTKVRTGTPSLHDPMHFEELQTFTFRE